ncbi:MAG: sortase [Anaerolineales bacterium]
MAKKSKSLDLNESELRRLLLEQRRADRRRRLDAFGRGGQLLSIDAERAEPKDGDPLGSPSVHADPNLRLDSPHKPRYRTLADRGLLAVEVLAVLGLGYVFFNGLSLLDELNREVASVFAGAPAASPTPLIGPVVLPSGHTPPGEGEAALPNEAEIPAHLRPLVQAYNAAVEAPTPGPEQSLGIKIAAIGVSAPIVQGDSWEDLKRGVGQHIGSANPGEAGNLVLTGHNDVYGEVFKELDQLEPGDEITVFTATSSYVYVVTETIVVSPTFVEVMDPTPNATLTLISCYPYLIDTQRIVVLAELQD